jgi:hypothetical protein
MSGIISDNVGRSSGLVKAAAAGAVPDWERISHQTASDDTEIDFTSFSSDYIDFKIMATKYVQASEVDLYFRLSVGGAFQDGAADYHYTFLGYDEDGVERRAASTGAAIIRPTTSTLGSSLGNGEVAGFEWILYNVHSTTYQKVTSFKIYYMTPNAGDMEFTTGAARLDQASSAVDGARIYASSGNIDVGEFTLYGRKIT